jgi:hypothetical protein
MKELLVSQYSLSFTTETRKTRRMHGETVSSVPPW